LNFENDLLENDNPEQVPGRGERWSVIATGVARR
jgi:hypothetical protein